MELGVGSQSSTRAVSTFVGFTGVCCKASVSTHVACRCGICLKSSSLPGFHMRIMHDDPSDDAFNFSTCSLEHFCFPGCWRRRALEFPQHPGRYKELLEKWRDRQKQRPQEEHSTPTTRIPPLKLSHPWGSKEPKVSPISIHPGVDRM